MKRVGKSLRQYGFTIVELLIVIVIIGILAALVIVAYNGIQARAYDSIVQSDLKNSYTKLQEYKITSSNDQYPLGGNNSELNTLMAVSRSAYGLPGGNNALLYCRSDTDVAVVGRSKSGQGYYYSSVNGSQAITTWPGDGNANLCPAAGIPTSSVGYGVSWMYANGVWQGWFTGGS